MKIHFLGIFKRKGSIYDFGNGTFYCVTNNILKFTCDISENDDGHEIHVMNFFPVFYVASDNILLNDGQDRASENEELKSQIEEAYMLVEKLMAENAELVEKVNMQGS